MSNEAVLITDGHVAEYREKGFIAFDRYVSDEDLNTLRGVFEGEFSSREPMPVDVERINKDMIQGLDPAQMVQMIRDSGKYLEDRIRGHCHMRHLAYFDPARELPDVFRTSLRERSLEVAEKLLEIPHEDLTAFATILWKPPGAGPTTWHQEDSFDHADRMQCTVGLWLALNDATIENGCMKIIPGSQFGPLRHHPALGRADVDPEEEARAVSVPLPAGGALLFNGRCLHASHPNASDEHRRSLTLVLRSPMLRTPEDHQPRGRIAQARGSRVVDAVSA